MWGRGRTRRVVKPFFSSDFSVAAVRDREDPSDDLMLLPAKDRVPSINSVTGIKLERYTTTRRVPCWQFALLKRVFLL